MTVRRGYCTPMQFRGSERSSSIRNRELEIESLVGDTHRRFAS